MALAVGLVLVASAPRGAAAASAERDVCAASTRAAVNTTLAESTSASAPASFGFPRDGRSGGSDEPLDPRSTGWTAGKKSPLPWILAIVGGVVVATAAGAGIFLWYDARARFPDDTLGVQPFRP